MWICPRVDHITIIIILWMRIFIRTFHNFLVYLMKKKKMIFFVRYSFLRWFSYHALCCLSFFLAIVHVTWEIFWYDGEEIHAFCSFCRRRCKIAESLVEKNFDLAFQVIYEFNLPGSHHIMISSSNPFFSQNLVLDLVHVFIYIPSSHNFQLWIYMLVLLHHSLREKRVVNWQNSLET